MTTAKWVWHQRDGVMTCNGAAYARGYAGRGKGKNNPDMQNVSKTGPLPQGMYRMAGVKDDPKTGPFTIVLEPLAGNEMFGRSAFRIHGDSVRDPGNASEGCICISPRSLRAGIYRQGDLVQVVA
jgi:hypothetical protein